MFKLQTNHDPQRSIWLVGDKVSLGSDPSCSLVLNGLGISAVHAEISIEQDDLILKCEPGSCYVDNKPVYEQYKLSAGQQLRLGGINLTLLDSKALSCRDTSSKKESVSPSISGSPDSLWKLLPLHPKLKSKNYIVDRTITLGRSKNCDYPIPSKLLSREHARLSIIEKRLLLEDAGSANGCFVNGEKVTNKVLTHGDLITFAKLEFRVQAPIEQRNVLEASAVEKSDICLDKTMIRPAVSAEMIEQLAASSELKEDIVPSMAATKGESVGLEALNKKSPNKVAGLSRYLAIALVSSLVLMTGLLLPQDWFH